LPPPCAKEEGRQSGYGRGTGATKALEEATRDTQKGAYHEIRLASDLLKRIDREKVRKRCPHCARLFDTLLRLIQHGLVAGWSAA
jgi:Domain of unknown function (DUF4276)